MLPLLGAMVCAAFAQQAPDTGFAPPIEEPAYQRGRGPRVAIDEAHHNFHTAAGRYGAFAGLLRRDGYRVTGWNRAFTATALRDTDVLVIANALNAGNVNNWTLPTPSAFTKEEIAAVVEWVRNGGSLLLIADHMPFPGAAMELGKALGVTFRNSYARSSKRRGGPDLFDRSSGALREHAITKGVDSVATFGGSAFRLDGAGDALLVLDDSFVSWEVKQASRFPEDTPRTPISGWLQGAAFPLGKGRVAVFGEAAMFSAQLAGPEKQPMGMNHPRAEQNPLLLRNLLRWLTSR